MKNNNHIHAPSLPEEQINQIIWQLSSTSEDELSSLTYQLKEIVDREKKKAFQAGLEEGKKLSKVE